MEVQELLRENFREVFIPPLYDDWDMKHEIAVHFNPRHDTQLGWRYVFHRYDDRFHPDNLSRLHDDLKELAIANISTLYTYLSDATPQQVQGDIQMGTWKRNGHNRHDGLLVVKEQVLYYQKLEVKCSKRKALNYIAKQVLDLGLSVTTWVQGPQQ